MPRTIDFDSALALDRATAVFWKQGYAGASLRDLLKAMKIGEGAFYNTFKSKKAVYLRCLELYETTEGQKRALALITAETASGGIRALFAAMLDCMDDPATPSRLCMQAAMATEEVLADPELRAKVENDITGFHHVLAGKLRHDKDAGLLPPTFDPEATASVLTTYCQGLWRMALVDYDRNRFEKENEALLQALGL